MEALKPVKEGKVREIYDNGDTLIMVATDRISCFDVILNNIVTKKGTVLTQMSKFWFDMTKDIIPNHMISVDVNDMPEFFRTPEFDGKSMMVRKLNMLPVECIVRGYITGSGWASYQKTGENISFEQSVDYLEKRFPGKGAEYAQKLKDCTIALIRHVLIMHFQKASLLQIPSLSSDLMRTVISFSVMRCSHLTVHVSGLLKDMRQVIHSLRLISSLQETGLRATRDTTGHYLRKSWI